MDRQTGLSNEFVDGDCEFSSVRAGRVLLVDFLIMEVAGG